MEDEVTDFIEMWRRADEADAEIGGMDSVPEEELYDYQMGLLIALGDLGLAKDVMMNKEVTNG